MERTETAWFLGVRLIRLDRASQAETDGPVLSEGNAKMKLGLIADTHDYVDGIRRAIQLFQVERVDRIFHLGDLCQPETAWEFIGIPTSYILGNNETELVSLRRAFQATGIEYLGEQAVLQVDGKTLCLYHGTRDSTVDRLIQSQEYDYLFKGHSHTLEDYTVGRTRVINPGAVYRAKPRTLATLRPESGELDVFELD